MFDTIHWIAIIGAFLTGSAVTLAVVGHLIIRKTITSIQIPAQPFDPVTMEPLEDLHHVDAALAQ